MPHIPPAPPQVKPHTFHPTPNGPLPYTHRPFANTIRLPNSLPLPPTPAPTSFICGGCLSPLNTTFPSQKEDNISTVLPSAAGSQAETLVATARSELTSTFSRASTLTNEEEKPLYYTCAHPHCPSVRCPECTTRSFETDDGRRIFTPTACPGSGYAVNEALLREMQMVYGARFGLKGLKGKKGRKGGIEGVGMVGRVERMIKAMEKGASEGGLERVGSAWPEKRSRGLGERYNGSCNAEGKRSNFADREWVEKNVWSNKAVSPSSLFEVLDSRME
ncbi:hypothetical protein BJ508DRAFT_365315 [Ascobolus immersus RN42]|uniref:Uncharacterized protein n=1 Tax=Ascobolus immersus RN42 TaxID=1160509 RepID=A0A3N4HQM3_ASCIM|nr:hypothetical protein BJ508DRAFT_365315 [Ascobolus immersus RN42]